MDKSLLVFNLTARQVIQKLKIYKHLPFRSYNIFLQKLIIIVYMQSAAV